MFSVILEIGSSVVEKANFRANKLRLKSLFYGTIYLVDTEISQAIICVV